MKARAIYLKLNAIENDIRNLKLPVLQHQKPKKIVSLKGLLKGFKLREEDFSDAKKSLFNA